jgi:hypothetical protein
MGRPEENCRVTPAEFLAGKNTDFFTFKELKEWLLEFHLINNRDDKNKLRTSEQPRG